MAEAWEYDRRREELHKYCEELARAVSADWTLSGDARQYLGDVKGELGGDAPRHQPPAGVHPLLFP